MGTLPHSLVDTGIAVSVFVQNLRRVGLLTLASTLVPQDNRTFEYFLLDNTHLIHIKILSAWPSLVATLWGAIRDDFRLKLGFI